MLINIKSIATLLLAAGAVLSMATASHAQSTPFYLHSGDRVVMYGDDATDARRYTNDVAAFIQTRYPDMRIKWFDKGWGGDSVAGNTGPWGGGPIDSRLDRDVTAFKPTVVTIQLGQSDSGVDANPPVAYNDSNLSPFNSGYEHIINKLTKDNPGVRITLITPSYYEDLTKPDKQAVLQHYIDSVIRIGSDNSLTAVNVSNPAADMLAKAQSVDSANASKLFDKNNIIANEWQDAVVAAAIVKVWGFSPTVSAVSIDGANGAVTQSVNSKVIVKSTTGSLTWQQTDGSLPLPIYLNDPSGGLFVKSSDLLASIDQETLQVASLPGASYDLKIDGVDVGAFTSAQLASGINLAQYNTPMLQQSIKALRYEHQYQDCVVGADRDLVLGNLRFGDQINADVVKAAKDLRAAGDLAESKAEQLSKPITRTFTLSPQ